MATTTTKRRAVKRPKPAATIAEAAAAIGVHQRTLKEWLSRGAPGEPGAYDQVAILAWRAATMQPVADGDDWQKRRTAAQAQREELRLSQLRRELIEVGQAARIVKRHAAEVRSHLDQLPDFAASLLKMPSGKRKEFVASLATKIQELCALFERTERELAEEAGSE